MSYEDLKLAGLFLVVLTVFGWFAWSIFHMFEGD